MTRHPQKIDSLQIRYAQLGIAHHEYIACKSNVEGHCTGQFWEGRFKSQALLIEQGLLTCMAYVDLNLVRTAITDSPESSDFTSVQQRIREFTDRKVVPIPLRLKSFSVEQKESDRSIAFGYADYLELIDRTGRCCRDDKRGHIFIHLLPILQRLNIGQDVWY